MKSQSLAHVASTNRVVLLHCHMGHTSCLHPENICLSRVASLLLVFPESNCRQLALFPHSLFLWSSIREQAELSPRSTWLPVWAPNFQSLTFLLLVSYPHPHLSDHESGRRLRSNLRNKRPSLLEWSRSSEAGENPSKADYSHRQCDHRRACNLSGRWVKWYHWNVDLGGGEECVTKRGSRPGIRGQTYDSLKVRDRFHSQLSSDWRWNRNEEGR